jgi:antitoxin MazE
MIKKLTKHGNSYALIIDRGVMDLLQIDKTTELHISTDGKCLIIQPAPNSNRMKVIDKSAKHSFKKFGKAYSNLSRGKSSAF